MLVTSEYIFNDPKLKKINNIIKNAQFEFERKCGYNYYRKVNVECNVKFFDKIKNETKSVFI